jgi:hypothetical protein
MFIWQYIKKPYIRTFAVLIALLLISYIVYLVWTPGEDLIDGRHDLGKNGIWVQHGWLGDNDWFKRNGKSDKLLYFRDENNIRKLAYLLEQNNITDIFPHLCPANSNGSIPPVDIEQTRRFLMIFEKFRVMPWVGGVLGENVHLSSPEWRKGFIQSISDLLNTYPQIKGVHINIEPCPSGNTDFLILLDEIRKIFPKDKILSVAAYPPPTIWQPYKEVHWEKDYFMQVASRADQLVVMLYDTALRSSKLYQDIVSKWTRETLEWSGNTSILLGVPLYDDPGVNYHYPDVENLPNALRGIHSGLKSFKSLPHNYQGLSLYCEWEIDESEWLYLKKHFLNK